MKKKKILGTRIMRTQKSVGEYRRTGKQQIYSKVTGSQQDQQVNYL